MAKEKNNIPTGLYWQGKKTEVERVSLQRFSVKLFVEL
jgi:hypothetical protein